MLYPEVSGGRVVTAYAAGLAVGVSLGILCASLLEGLRRTGRFGRFIAHLMAWFVGYCSGTLAAVMVAGPYLFTGPTRGGHWITTPITAREIVVLNAVIALIFTLLGLRDPVRSRG